MTSKYKYRIPLPRDTVYHLDPYNNRDKYFQIAQSVLLAHQNVNGDAIKKQEKMMEKMKQPYNKKRNLNKFMEGHAKLTTKLQNAQKNYNKRLQDARDKAEKDLVAKKKIVESKRAAVAKAQEELKKAEHDVAVKEDEIKTIKVNRKMLNNLQDLVVKKSKLGAKLADGNIKNHLIYGNSDKAKRKRFLMTYASLYPSYKRKKNLKEQAFSVLKNYKEPIYTKDVKLKQRLHNINYMKKVTLPKNSQGKYALPIKIRNKNGKLKTLAQISKDYKDYKDYKHKMNVNTEKKNTEKKTTEKKNTEKKKGGSNPRKASSPYRSNSNRNDSNTMEYTVNM